MPLAKKRKLDSYGMSDTPVPAAPGPIDSQHGNGYSVAHNGHPSGSWTDPEASPSIVLESTSFSTPQRKKLRLEFVEGENGGIRAVKAAGEPPEFGVKRKDIGTSGQDKKRHRTLANVSRRAGFLPSGT